MITKIQAGNYKYANYNYSHKKSNKNEKGNCSNTLVEKTSKFNFPQNYNVMFTGTQTLNPFIKSAYKEISAPAMEIIEQAHGVAKKHSHKEVTHYHIIHNAIKDTQSFIQQFERGEIDLIEASPESGSGYFRDFFTPKVFENTKYRAKFKAVLNETIETIDGIFSKLPTFTANNAQPADKNIPKFADNLVKDIIFEKSTTTLAEEGVPVISGVDVYNGIFNTNVKEIKNFIRVFAMKLNGIYQLEDTSDEKRIHFPNYDDKAEIAMKSLNKGTNMFITYDNTKIEPNSFVPSLKEVFKHSTGKFNPSNTEIIEFNENITQDFLQDTISTLKKNQDKNYIVMFSQQNMIKNEGLDCATDDEDYLNLFKKTPKNIGLVAFDTKDSYLSSLSNEEIFDAIKDTAENSIPVLTKEDVYNALKNSSFLKQNKININNEALEKIVEISTQMEGKFPAKSIYLLKKIDKYCSDKPEIALSDVNDFIKESEHIFKKTGNESSIDIVFNTGKTLNDIVGKHNTQKEAENIVRQIKNNTIGTKGFIIYSQDGSVGAGRRHTAEAIAGEAKIPFVSINTMDFGTKDVDLFGGNAISPEAAIKKLFSLVSTQAETNSHKSAVLFIENFEYFSVGEMISEYHQKAMAQLIREMNNAGKKGLNIVVIGSVFDPRLLGEATTKSFKFNDNIEVSSPMINVSEREEILRYTIKNSDIKLAGSEEEKEAIVKSMAKTLRGFAFIDLKKFVQKAEAIATERRHELIEKEDLIESYLRLTTGRPNLENIPQHEKELVTKHECGHAITLQVMNNLMHKSGKEWMIPHTVNFITLDPRSFYGGAMYNVLDTNNEQCFENALSSIICSYGGHSAEKTLFGMDGSWGITCDLDLATSTAEKMVTAMGMGSNTGKISIVNMYGEEDFERNITPRLRNKIEKDVEVITKNALTASDMIVETYSSFINEFADRYANSVGTGDCLIDGDQFRKELAEWKAKQPEDKLAELELLDKMLLEIIDATKKGKLY